MTASLAALLVAAISGPPGWTLLAQDPLEPPGPPAVYTELREAGLEPAGRLEAQSLRVDRFEFSFQEGQLYLLAPVERRVTGAVFLGRGSVRALPPDAVEHHQLKKFLDADLLEESFERLVLRASDDTIERLARLVTPGPTGDGRKANDLYRERHETLFRDQLVNLDSRILIDLLEGARRQAPSAGYLAALVDGNRRGWFTIEIDPRLLEEVTVARYDSRQQVTDVWMRFHARGDFDPSDAAAGLEAPPVAPESIGKKADEITGADLGLPARPAKPTREQWAPWIDAPLVSVDLALEPDGATRGTAALLVEPLRDLATVRLRISPWLRVVDVRWRHGAAVPSIPAEDADAAAFDLLAPGARGSPERAGADRPVPAGGEPVPFVQERRGRALAEDLFEPWVTVALPRAVQPGERFVLEVAYEGKILERLRNREHLVRDSIYWMPVPSDDRHSRYHLTFRVRGRDEVVSGGELVSDHVDDGTRIIRRLVRRPSLRVSFHYGQFDRSDTALAGLPPISLYENRNRLGFAPGSREKTLEDLEGAIEIYGRYFGAFPYGALQVTETSATSGQAFPGFLLLSYASFGELHTGEAELFRSHEVAHQWWGAGVHWRDYRDQWLSEGFAQYAAALYVLAGLDNESQFREILGAWRRDVQGEVDIGQIAGRHYGLQPAVIRKSQGSASGPLVAGARLRSTKTPFDYRLLVYEKGAFVLHMLRMMLLDPETGDDARFRTLMRGFAERHLHQTATTDDFEAAVTDAFGEPMDWFFDQWVYGVDVPTYRPRLDVVPNPEAGSTAPWLLRGVVTQEEVPDGFRMPVPIAIRFADRGPLVHHQWVDSERVELSIPLPERPTGVEFNYLDGVLAKVR